MWQNEEKDVILVWFIAKHKHVSRLMTLIDDSKNRTARQHISSTAALLETRQNGDEQDDRPVQLNPFGNVPLKVYEIQSQKINETKKDSWSPCLRLAKEERKIIEAEGTVLLLGRPGAGKTVCI